MNWTGRITDHYARNWKTAVEPCSFTAGPVRELPQCFKVLKFAPHKGRRLWTYAICGLSRPDDRAPIELHLFSPEPNDGIVELLYAIAHFHRTGSRLNLWHTVNFGRPWLGTSLCSYGLISLPYLDGPQLENLEDLIGKIKFYWLIPITPAELDLKQASGIEALEARFEEVGFEYSDPARASVV